MDRTLVESIAPGSSVHSSDGEKLGTVAAIHDASILVEKGLIFVKDYNVPVTAIASVDPENGEVTLNVTKETALASNWEIHEDEEPEEWDDEPPVDSPIDGEGDRVLTGAAETPSLPIIEELEEGDPPLRPAEA
jgi:Uncharacterized protein conserved in bacteria (DUF2171)